jgi:hypothetical protein
MCGSIYLSIYLLTIRRDLYYSHVIWTERLRSRGRCMSVRRMGGLVYLLDGRGAPRFIILGSTEMLPPSSCPRTIRACSATFRSMRKSVAASLGRAVGLVLDVHRPVAPVGLDADDIAVSSGVVARLPHGRVRWSGDGQDRLRPDLEGCPNKAIRHDCILKELQKL